MNRCWAIPAGIILSALTLLAPIEMAYPSRLTLAITALMLVWWVTEAIPIYATALVPLACFPLAGILTFEEAGRAYADSTVFLFMGGFLIAAAMERWNLHRRIALTIIGHSGTDPRTVVLAFMLATAFLSMWISNTATAMMMVPIALSLAKTLNWEGEEPRTGDEFAKCLLISVAYAATIGGMATIIGTPPNGIFVAQLKKLFPLATGIDFFTFMLFALPYSFLFLFLSWIWLTRGAFRRMPERIPDEGIPIAKELEAMRPMHRGEKLTLAVFTLTALAWIMRSEKDLGFVTLPGIATIYPGIQDSTIAILGALLLFILPVELKKPEFVLDWETAKGIPWGILILFGGGICLSEAFLKSGLAQAIANRMAVMQVLPLPVIMLILALSISFTSELVSNTAIASLMIPLMAFAAVSLQVNPVMLMLIVALASSQAFMLPVGTPPNAIVYASNRLTTRDMAVAGLAMNLMGAILLVLFILVVVPAVTGLAFAMPEWARLGG